MTHMRPLVEFPRDARRAVRHVLTDIDDTLTDRGRLGAEAYGALEAVSAAGMTVVIVTGRPAGWCDMIARQWPVSAVVGENGACYMRYDAARGRMERRFWRDGAARAADRARLKALGRRILREVPGTALASDQPYREADLAIDYCEDVAPLGPEAVERILGLFRAAGATAKASSIHVNGWFGDYDKLAMSKRLFAEVLGVELDRARDNTVFVGDSPNDEPMFTYFPNAVGVANVRRFLPGLRNLPRWVTRAEGGAGFAELVDALLEARTQATFEGKLPRGAGQRLAAPCREGVHSAESAAALARRHNLDTPITHAVDAVLNHGADVDRAIAELFAHPCRMEAPLVNRVNGSSDWVR